MKPLLAVMIVSGLVALIVAAGFYAPTGTAATDPYVMELITQPLPRGQSYRDLAATVARARSAGEAHDILETNRTRWTRQTVVLCPWMENVAVRYAARPADVLAAQRRCHAYGRMLHHAEMLNARIDRVPRAAWSSEPAVMAGLVP